jgi:hypothetical protein
MAVAEGGVGDGVIGITTDRTRTEAIMGTTATAVVMLKAKAPTAGRPMVRVAVVGPAIESLLPVIFLSETVSHPS